MRPKERYRKAKTSIFVGIFGNLLLGLFKLFLGILGNSIAVVVDSVHSISDILTSVVVWIGLKVGKKPPDRLHPYGHGDAEPIAGLIVSIVLCVVGFEFARDSIYKIFSGVPFNPAPIALIAVVASIFIKYWMFRYVVKIGESIDSHALIADAYHHKSDFYTSVVVLFGVAGAVFGFGILDPIIGIFISLWIIKIGFDLGRKNIKSLMGEIPSESILVKIRKIANEVEDVKGLHDVRVHYTGPYATVTLHLNIDKKLSLSKVHGIATEVEDKIKERIESITNVIVHPEPA